MIAEVIVDIATSETDRIFDYLCDDDTVVGSRVRVPFGNKILCGFVMRLKETTDCPQEKLKKILFEYGEERFSSRIASNIIRERERKPIETTGELVEIIKRSIPSAARDGGHHPAKRSFQALRIEVNAELDVIAPAIRSAVRLLNPGGRIAIITFHSLEDRIVKQTFASLAEGCTCPKSFPVCVCGKRPEVKVISKKPILPSKEELEENPRSRSAKLRVAEKL